MVGAMEEKSWAQVSKHGQLIKLPSEACEDLRWPWEKGGGVGGGWGWGGGGGGGVVFWVCGAHESWGGFWGG